MKRLTPFVLVFALSISTAAETIAQTTELILAHVGGQGSLYDLSANEFAKRANEKLPANFRVIVSGQSRLGNDTELLQKITRGEVTFSLPSSVMSTVSPKFAIFELPFLIRSHEHVRQISNVLLKPVLQPAVKARGFRILAIWENGFRQITNNVRPIRTPADLADLKLRVPKGKWRIKAFEKLGARPVPMALSDTYEALHKRQVDGQENPLAQIRGSKLDQVQRYLTLSDHIYSPAYLITSEARFSRLPEDVQQILSSTANEMRDWVYRMAVQTEGDLLDELTKTMETNQIDVEAFRAVSRPLYVEFAGSVPDGFDLMLKVSDLAEAQEPTSSD